VADKAHPYLAGSSVMSRHILSQQGLLWTEVGRQSADCNTLGVLGASLSIYYDSLIEKCSTLPRLCFSTGVECLLLFKPSVGTEVTSRSALNYL
jgi:hypothetical protein